MRHLNLKFLTAVLLLAAGLPALNGQTLSALIDPSYYGWLDQYSMNSAHNFVGNEACAPTSSTNAMTMLQNLYPGIFSSDLTGSSYASWQGTCDTLISIMGTTAGPNGGTEDPRLVNGLYDYIVTTKGFTNTLWSGMFPHDDGWSAQYPAPDFLTFGKPTAEFLHDSLLNQAALLLGIDYCDSVGNLTGGGHELLANGIIWDLASNTGTISFIDPLDPSQSYGSGGAVNGPALQTTGTISLTADGRLLLYYDQFEFTGIKENPGPADYSFLYARIDEALAVRAVPEPSTIGAVLVGIPCLLIFLRRRRRSGSGLARCRHHPVDAI